MTVSGSGLANGQSTTTNAGADFGPDTPETSTSGFQEAVNAAQGGGRVTSIGNLTLSTTVVISKPVEIDLGTSTITLAPGTDRPMFRASGTSGVHIRAGLLEGGRTAQSNTGHPVAAIECRNLTDSSVDGVVIQNAGTWGILVQSGRRNSITSCRVINSGYDGIVVAAGETETVVANCTVTGAGAGQSEGDGITFYRGALRCVGIGCTSDGAIGNGFTVGSNAGAIVEGCGYVACEARGNKAAGFAIAYQDGSTSVQNNCFLIECLAEANKGDGFYFNRAIGCVISGCVARNNSQSVPKNFLGFRFDDDLNGNGSLNNVMSGCIAEDNQNSKTQARGLGITNAKGNAASTGNYIVNNRFGGNAYGPLIQNSSNTIVGNTV